MGEHTFSVEFDRGDAIDFTCPTRFEHDGKQGLGQGAFGAVCGGIDKKSGGKVAIKKNLNVFSSKQAMYKATVRELQLLDHFTNSGGSPHPNIVQILDAFAGEKEDKNSMDEIYFVMQAFDMNLREVMKDEDLCNGITIAKRASLMFQLLSGLQTIHDAGCLHRDIKPENVLVGSIETDTPQLAICDLGSGRAVDAFVTQDVLVTTWPYVAPEAMIVSPQNPWAIPKDSKIEKENPKSLDLWSAACIWGELLSGEQMFPEAKFGPAAGVQKMAHVLGTPADSLMELVQAEQLRGQLQKIGDGRSYGKFMEENGLLQSDDNPEGATPGEAAVVERMLAMDPGARPGINEILDDKFFASVDGGKTPSIPAFKEETKSDLSEDEARTIVWDIMQRYEKSR